MNSSFLGGKFPNQEVKMQPYRDEEIGLIFKKYFPILYTCKNACK